MLSGANTPVMGVRSAVYGVFHPRWFAGGVLLGLALELAAWVTGVGLFAGLTGMALMGTVIGWASPGNTVVEPGVAAFVIAAVGFVVDHLLLSALGVGVVLAAGYGAVGLAVGVVGGWLGERLQATA